MEQRRPRRAPFDELEWTGDAPGIRAREARVSGARSATVEYETGASRAEWCEEGHRGYVLSGEYEFDDGSPHLRASENEAFLLPCVPLGEGANWMRNPRLVPTRLFLIDDRPGE